VLGPIIVSQPADPEPFEHFRPLLRPAPLRVERHDAPGNQVLAGVDLRRWLRMIVGMRRKMRNPYSASNDKQDPAARKRHWLSETVGNALRGVPGWARDDTAATQVQFQDTSRHSRVQFNRTSGRNRR